MSFSGWHPWIESAQVLSVSKLQTWAILFPESVRTGVLTWTDAYGDETYRVQYRAELHDSWGRLDLTDEHRTYGITLSTTALNFGGRRWWMHCPFTSRRALKLHRYPSLGKFCHRTAIRPLPTYASQRISGLDRIMERRWAIRRKLGDEGSLFDSLQKPKWMRWRTFERYEQLDETLAAQEDAALIDRFRCLGIFG